jgi:hypothetical protein
MVDSHGQVVATVFAALTGTSRPGGFGVPNSLVRSVLNRTRGQTAAVPAGHCAG